MKARSRSANVVHHFTIGAGKSFGTLAQMFRFGIRFGILASAAIVTRFMSPAVIQI